MTEEQFDAAQSFWALKDKEAKKMPREQILSWYENFLASHKVLALSTSDGDFVRCTPLEYNYFSGKIWIFTEGGLKFRALRKNRNVCAAVFDTDASFGGLKSVQITGDAEFPELFSDEYLAAAEQRKIPVQALKSLKSPMWLIKIVPSEIICLNSEFKKGGFSTRQIIKKE